MRLQRRWTTAIGFALFGLSAFSPTGLNGQTSCWQCEFGECYNRGDWEGYEWCYGTGSGGPTSGCLIGYECEALSIDAVTLDGSLGLLDSPRIDPFQQLSDFMNQNLDGPHPMANEVHVVRRGCDGAIVDRVYSREAAEELRLKLRFIRL